MGKATDLHVGAQVTYIVMAGAGMGLMLGQANTDAINRASRYSYGEATGITQTVRNYGASLGFAVLGTVLITQFRSQITSSLTAGGLPHPAAATEAAKIAQLQGGNGNAAAIPPFIRADFAAATGDVLYGMTIVMAVAAVVALRGLRRGVQEDTTAADTALSYHGPTRTPSATSTRLPLSPAELRDETLHRCRGPGHRRPGGCADHAASAAHGLPPARTWSRSSATQRWPCLRTLCPPRPAKWSRSARR